jgi:MYXO-CTERM domain-containing protein
VIQLSGLGVGDLLAQGTDAPLTFTGTASAVGNHGATLTVAASDDTSLPGAQAVADTDYTIQFTVLDHAAPSATHQVVNLGTVLVGASDQTDSSATYGNEARGDGLRADLEVTGLSGLPAGVIQLSGLGVGDLLAQGTDAPLTFTGTASAVGNHGATLTVAASDDISLSGAQAVADTDYTIQFTVLDHSEASFNAGFDLDTLTLNFGTVNQGAVVSPLGFSIFNLSVTPGLTAGLDLDGIDADGDSSALTTSLELFTNLAESESFDYLVFFDTSTVGSFEAIYILSVSDEDMLGAIAGTDLVLTLRGVVRPEDDAVPPVSEPAGVGLISLALLAWRRRRL